MTLRRDANPYVEMLNVINEKIIEHISRMSYPELGKVVSKVPFIIKADTFDFNLEYGADFIVSDHLLLDINDRVVLIPLNNTKLIVIAKISIEDPVVNSSIGYSTNSDFVGFNTYASSDNNDVWPTIFSRTWSTIRGSVNSVLRVLTHIDHYHDNSNPLTTSEVEIADHGTHSHTVSVPATNTATNPE